MRLTFWSVDDKTPSPQRGDLSVAGASISHIVELVAPSREVANQASVHGVQIREGGGGVGEDVDVVDGGVECGVVQCVLKYNLPCFTHKGFPKGS